MENFRKKITFGNIPRIEKCCFCVKNLRAAIFIIAIGSVFIGYHEILITFRPGCTSLYKEAQTLTKPLKIVAGMLFAVNVLMISSATILFITVFWKWNPAGDLFLLFGAASAITSLAFAGLYLAQLFVVACYYNASDIITLSIYSVLWIYFIMVVNSYRQHCTRVEGNPVVA